MPDLATIELAPETVHLILQVSDLQGLLLQLLTAMVGLLQKMC